MKFGYSGEKYDPKKFPCCSSENLIETPNSSEEIPMFICKKCHRFWRGWMNKEGLYGFGVDPCLVLAFLGKDALFPEESKIVEGCEIVGCLRSEFLQKNP